MRTSAGACDVVGRGRLPRPGGRLPDEIKDRRGIVPRRTSMKAPTNGPGLDALARSPRGARAGARPAGVALLEKPLSVSQSPASGSTARRPRRTPSRSSTRARSPPATSGPVLSHTLGTRRDPRNGRAATCSEGSVASRRGRPRGVPYRRAPDTSPSARAREPAPRPGRRDRARARGALRLAPRRDARARRPHAARRGRSGHGADPRGPTW